MQIPEVAFLFADAFIEYMYDPNPPPSCPANCKAIENSVIPKAIP